MTSIISQPRHKIKESSRFARAMSLYPQRMQLRSCSATATISSDKMVKVKVKVSPTTGRRDGPRESGYVKAPDFLTFGTTRSVGRQPHAPAAFTRRGIAGTHF